MKLSSARITTLAIMPGRLSAHPTVNEVEEAIKKAVEEEIELIAKEVENFVYLIGSDYAAQLRGK